MESYYRKYRVKNYSRTDSSILRVLRKSDFAQSIDIVERVTYDTYYKIAALHRKHSNPCHLYVTQMDTQWIEIELIVKPNN